MYVYLSTVCEKTEHIIVYNLLWISIVCAFVDSPQWMYAYQTFYNGMII